ncbi:hypothetical protein Tco_1252515 [Tanacetum coccineum]
MSECNYVLTCEGFGAYMWPIQVNPSTSDELKGDINNEDYEDVGDKGFVYNSDGELTGELESSSKTEEERVV